jgi:hypothetical protein
MNQPLRLPALRQSGTQLPIWDWVGNVQFVHWAQTRHATGQFAEELILKLLGGSAMVTDGQADICPDIKLSDHHYVEVKSVGEKRQGIAYEHIIDRSMRFVRRNRVQVSYAFVIHDVRAADSPDLFALRRAMAASIKRVVIVPFSDVLTALAKRPLEIMNYRSKSAAGKPDEPMPGWRIPAAQLRAWCTGQPTFAFDRTVFGCPTGGFPVFRS